MNGQFDPIRDLREVTPAAAVRREFHEQGAHAERPDGDCPDCQREARRRCACGRAVRDG